MLPRSRFARVLLFGVPLILAAVLWLVARDQRPRFVKTPAMAQVLALSYDGSRLGVATEKGEFLWVENGASHTLDRENAKLFYSDFAAGSPPSLQFSRDGKLLFGSNIFLSNDNTKTAYAWNLASGKIAWSAASAYKDDENGYSFARDATRLAQHSYDVVKVRVMSSKCATQPERARRLRIKGAVMRANFQF